MPRSDVGFAILGGPNGCGKSTLARELSGGEFLFGTSAINPDDLTKQARAQLKDLGQVGADLAGVERAEKAVWRAIAHGESVSVETVLSSEKYLEVVEAAKARGYHTRLHFVALPTVEMALQRIASRVMKGGHDVPEDRVRKRWTKAHDNLVKYISFVHELLVFANVNDRPILVLYARNGSVTFRDNQDLLPEVHRRLR